MTDTAPPTQISDSSGQPASDLLAAIDLGSNSFHMVVARLVQGQLRTVERLGEKVQIGAGLDDKGRLTDECQARALECLNRFAQYIRGLPPSSVQAVGTNALRVARNTRDFLEKAEQILGYPIAVIAGREEARLIYLGVAHTLADDVGKRLVIDIGGGSTEFIIGERFETRLLESLHMGCVSFTQRYFPDGKITRGQLEKAQTHAMQELLNIRQFFLRQGWQSCVGSSGSIRAVSQVVKTLGMSADVITRPMMQEVRRRIIDLGHADRLVSLGVREDRCSIFAAGFAILYAAFESLQIEQMSCADGALREGLLYDMLGRIHHEDVRERTIGDLLERYMIDRSHGESVQRTAMYLLDQLAQPWGLEAPPWRDALRWAAQVHEVGLAISHAQYHKHGAYLLQFSDLPGFSRQFQLLISVLVRAHRRKIQPTMFEVLDKDEVVPATRLAIILRLAVLMQHGRRGEFSPAFALRAQRKLLQITFEAGWLDQHPLIRVDLEQERVYLSRVDVILEINESAVGAA